MPTIKHLETDGVPAAGSLGGMKRESAIAFVFGMAIIGASIFVGRKYAFFFSFLAFSFIMTLLWRKAPRPWIFLASVSAATPIAISRQQFACNLIFALWFVVLNMRYLFRLPKWIYVPAGLAIFGILTSSINWMSDDIVRNLMRQGAFAYNLFLAPFLLLPIVYSGMTKSRDQIANLRGLLLCLILPSTLILISAKLFGTISNPWEASLHVESLPEGFFQYEIGKVVVNFLRTEVGFILAALICASAAVAASRVPTSYRLLAGACLASNTFLLLVTGSFGSAFACLCGLAAIFYAQFRSVRVGRAAVSAIVIALMLVLTYIVSPPSVKGYLEKRYDHRVTNANDDRLGLWERAVAHLFDHPEGVGMTLAVGDRVKSFIHNDYLVYAVSYGIMGGIAYAYLVAMLLISFFRRRRSAIDDPCLLAITLAGLGVIVAIAINSITDHMNSNRWYFNVIWSLIWYSYFCGPSTQGPQKRALGGRDTKPVEAWRENVRQQSAKMWSIN